MAVKKITKEDVEVNVVEQTTTTTNDVETSIVDTDKTETTVETKEDEEEQIPDEDEVKESEVPSVDVEVGELEVKEPKVDVDIESAEVKDCNRPNSGVKIRMRVDHSCTIAMERYDLKAGKTYIVPANVKRILNNAGLLSPL